MHEGSTNPWLSQELRSASDLRAMEITARSLGKAMSTLVVQERHVWLSLVETSNVNNVRFRLPGWTVWRHCRGLCPAVLASTEADRGHPTHPAPE